MTLQNFCLDLLALYDGNDISVWSLLIRFLILIAAPSGSGLVTQVLCDFSFPIFYLVGFFYTGKLNFSSQGEN